MNSPILFAASEKAVAASECDWAIFSVSIFKLSQLDFNVLYKNQLTRFETTL